MSYCEIIFFKNGKPNTSIESQNSWGGAAYIWDCLFDKYLKDPTKEYDSWLGASRNNDRRLWDLYKNPELPFFMKAVHVSTFDYAIVRRENFAEYAKHLEEFVRYFGTNGRACHLYVWAEAVKTSKDEAIGFYHTSVTDNPWYQWNEKKEKYIPYNLKKGEKHFEVYDSLKEDEEKQSVKAGD